MAMTGASFAPVGALGGGSAGMEAADGGVPGPLPGPGPVLSPPVLPGVLCGTRVYHVSVMPCYDKKLEASRDELTLPGTSTPEVGF